MDIVHVGDCRDEVPYIDSEAFFISDPPYNQKYHYATYEDSLESDEYLSMLHDVFRDRKAVIIHYPEETINLLGGVAWGRANRSCRGSTTRTRQSNPVS
jgi:hypothetical protein